MGNQRKGACLAGISILVLLCSGLALMEAIWHPLETLYNDVVLDNRIHYVPCERLPTREEVERILADHAAAVEQIEAINPGNVQVMVMEVCPGRADIQIGYATHANRVAIETILGEDLTFFGVPVRLLNW